MEEFKYSFKGFAEAVEKIYMTCEHCGLPLKRDQSYIFPGTLDGSNQLMHKHCYSREVGRKPLSASSRVE